MSSMENMLETIETLLRGVQIMEKRPLSSHVEIVGIEPLWPLVSAPGIMHSTTKKLVELAFDHGGYIAGGFGRWAATSNRSAMERGEYVACGGDIDLFFNSRDGWADYLRALANFDDSALTSIGTSQGNLAVNLIPRHKQNEHAYNAPPAMQAVGCAAGTPVQILRSFDFVNCMFAIDRDRSYAADAALKLEKEGVLGVSSWSSRGLVHRMSKYHNKYGYKTCRDMSEGRRVDHMLDVAGRFPDERSAYRSAQHWAAFLASTHENFFEDAGTTMDILTCGILPFDDAGRLTSHVMTKDHKCEGTIGTYRAGLNSLLEREKKAKKLSEDEYKNVLNSIDDLFDEENVRYSSIRAYNNTPDNPSWTAEQYCWSY